LSNHSIYQYVDVVLPLSLRQFYTYSIPNQILEDNKVGIGKRVVVQFGKSKLYSAIILRIHNDKPKLYDTKEIEYILDKEAIVTTKQLQLWEWIAEYYMCTLGEVMAVALPSALKLSSESKFLYNEVEKEVWEKLTDNEYIIAEALQANKELTLEDVQNILMKKNVYPLLQQLMYYRICVVKEELQKKYSPKKIAFIKLNERFKSENALKTLFEKLDRKPKQLEVLFHYLHLLLLFFRL